MEGLGDDVLGACRDRVLDAEIYLALVSVLQQYNMLVQVTWYYMLHSNRCYTVVYVTW